MDQGTVRQLSMFAPVDPPMSAILQIDAFSHPPAVMDHFREPQIDKD